MDLGENGCHMETGKIAEMSAMNFSHRYLTSATIQKRLLWLLLTIVISLTIIKTSIPLLENFLVVKKELPHAEALVVMAGSMTERLPVAARLFQDGVAPRILLTNDGNLGAWSAEKNRNLYSIEWAESDLTNMQVPDQAIVKLTYSASGSIYDALNSRKEILEKGIQSIIIVTSDYHTRRSLWTFERILRDHPVAIGTYPVTSALSKSSDFEKFPELCREMIKYLYYTLSYQFIE
ncbi:MAG TPA: hypothetical protein DDY32_10910 [Desulfobulbaceae bacterium]|nr:hypothetical protein [Desulfobulbaceae bacterium]